MREVLRQFEISAPPEEVIDREFWVEVRPRRRRALFVILDCTAGWRPTSRTCAARTCATRWASR